MRHTMTRLALAGLCWSALACGQTKVVGSQYVATALITAKSGGTLGPVSAADDPKLAGAEIQIPATALAQDTTITLTEGSALDLPAEDAMASAAVAELGPSGTRFSLPVTITLPYQPTGKTSDLEVVAVEDDGTTTVVGNADLALDTKNDLASFTVAGFTRFGIVHGVGVPCPAGETLCGCNGGGRCVPAGVACPAICPAPGGGNGGGPGGTGGSCCPAGEYFCGCNGSGSCVPDTVACLLNCPLEAAAGGSGAASPAPGLPPPAACCPPGEYYCGCPGSTNGSCVSDTAMCAWDTLACPAPVPGGDAGSTGGNCCGAGEYFCGCPGEPGSCVPVGQSCVIACPAQPSGGAPTPPPTAVDCCPQGDYFCGCNGSGNCIPDGQACAIACPVSTGGGTGGGSCSGPLPPCAAGEQPVCDNGQWSCIGSGSGGGSGGCACACPATGPCNCACDGGTVCPAGQVDTACGCLPPNVLCVPPGCPQGDTECCGSCIPAGEVCTATCPVDAGIPPPCGCACPANDPSCVCACGDAGPAPCPTGDYRCPDGQCIPQGAMCTACMPCCDGSCAAPGSVCPTVCAADAGSGVVDGGIVCPMGETECCGQCQPSGVACPSVCATDAGTPACPAGENLCCNVCQPAGQPCTITCVSADAG